MVVLRLGSNMGESSGVKIKREGKNEKNMAVSGPQGRARGMSVVFHVFPVSNHLPSLHSIFWVDIIDDSTCLNNFYPHPMNEHMYMRSM